MAPTSDLGELLTVRTKGPGQRFVLAIVALALGVVGLGFTPTSIQSFGTVGQPAPAGSTPVTTGSLVVMLILGALALWLSWLALRSVLSVYRFHERGLTRSVLARITRERPLRSPQFAPDGVATSAPPWQRSYSYASVVDRRSSLPGIDLRRSRDDVHE
ncbi:MAG: hypothetical protein AB7I19_11760 [Planctomycetota bacterium]